MEASSSDSSNSRPPPFLNAKYSSALNNLKSLLSNATENGETKSIDKKPACNLQNLRYLEAMLDLSGASWLEESLSQMLLQILQK